MIGKTVPIIPVILANTFQAKVPVTLATNQKIEVMKQMIVMIKMIVSMLFDCYSINIINNIEDPKIKLYNLGQVL